MLRQSFDETIQERFRERVVSCVIFLRNTARKEVKEPWFLPVLLPTFGTVAKSRSRPETRNFSIRHGQKYLASGDAKHPLAPGRETLYFSGVFFIFAQVRGNWGGVSLTLRITTSRWVTSVPGMA